MGELVRRMMDEGGELLVIKRKPRQVDWWGLFGSLEKAMKAMNAAILSAGVMAVVLAVGYESVVRADAGGPAQAASRALPEFILTVRAYGRARYDDFQRRSMRELGLGYVQGLVDFTWDHVERGDNVWKWVVADEQMDRLAESGLKVVAFVICPKSPGLPWDETVIRADPRLAAQYEEFAYHLVDLP